MVADDDPVAQRLREAVWADPDSDAPRMVYADYLMARGDLYGELIALQLERARAGTEITARERELRYPHGLRALDSMRAWLRDSTVSRGFLASAGVMPGMPVEAAHHASWATLEELNAIGVHPIFDNRHLRATTLHTTGAVLFALSSRSSLPFRSIAGWQPHVGLNVGADTRAVFDAPGAFEHVRAIGLTAADLEPPSQTHPILSSPLFARLQHFDLAFTGIQLDELRRWQRWLPSTRLARFSVHVPFGHDTLSDISESVGSDSSEPSNFLYCEVATDTDHLVIQLDDSTWQQSPDDMVAVVAEVAGGRTRVVVEVLERGATSSDHDHRALLGALRSRFEVSVADRAIRRRAP